MTALLSWIPAVMWFIGTIICAKWIAPKILDWMYRDNGGCLEEGDRVFSMIAALLMSVVAWPLFLIGFFVGTPKLYYEREAELKRREQALEIKENKIKRLLLAWKKKPDYDIIKALEYTELGIKDDERDY